MWSRAAQQGSSEHPKNIYKLLLLLTFCSDANWTWSQDSRFS